MIFPAIFGQIQPPAPFQNVAGQYGDVSVGLVKFLNNIIRLLIVVGGLWAFINLILAGYGFLAAGEDQKKITAAWQKIWQSMLGVLFILGSFVLAAIFGWILFGNPQALLTPIIYGP
ncbi:MAG: hypothetical protein ABH807_00075 [Candidatus Shapirobacteria bacterium]